MTATENINKIISFLEMEKIFYKIMKNDSIIASIDNVCLCISSDAIGHYFACKAIDGSNLENIKSEYETSIVNKPNFLKRIGFWAVENREYKCSQKIHLDNSTHTYAEITNEIKRYLKR